MSLSQNLNETNSDSEPTFTSPTAQGSNITPVLTPPSPSHVIVSDESSVSSLNSAQDPATPLTASDPSGMNACAEQVRLRFELQDRRRRAPPVFPTPEEMALLEQMQAAEPGSVEQHGYRILLRQAVRLRTTDRRAYLLAPLDEAIEKAQKELAELQAQHLGIRIRIVYARLEGLHFERGRPEVERLRPEFFRLLHELFALRPEEYADLAELVPSPNTPATADPAAENDTSDDMDEVVDNDGAEDMDEFFDNDGDGDMDEVFDNDGDEFMGEWAKLGN